MFSAALSLAICFSIWCRSFRRVLRVLVDGVGIFPRAGSRAGLLHSHCCGDPHDVAKQIVPLILHDQLGALFTLSPASPPVTEVFWDIDSTSVLIPLHCLLEDHANGSE